MKSIVFLTFLFCAWIFVALAQCQAQPSKEEIGDCMPYTTQKFETKNIVGIELRTINIPNRAEVEIPQLWQRFFQNGGTEQIPNRVSDDIIALYTDYEGDYTDPYTIIIGCEVSTYENLSKKLVCKEIPAATYAVFEITGQFPESVKKTWEKVWGTPLNRTYTTDMEIYPADFDPVSNSKAEIYIGIVNPLD